MKHLRSVYFLYINYAAITKTKTKTKKQRVRKV